MSIRREIYARLDFLAKNEGTDIDGLISKLLDSYEQSQATGPDDTTSSQDNRRHDRRNVSFPAVVNIVMTHGGTAFYKGKVTDISLGGIRIQLEPDTGNFYENLSLATSFEIVFLENVNSNIVTADCTVCRLEYLDHLCIAGKFNTMNLDDLSFIKEVN